jgi:hypothetical protein
VQSGGHFGVYFFRRFSVVGYYGSLLLQLSVGKRNNPDG